MQELLKCKNLLDNDRVEIAYWNLMGYKDKALMLYSISGSTADVAFQMRDALRPEDERWTWEGHLTAISHARLSMTVLTSYSLRHASADDWIIAAVLTWEATQ